MSEVRKTFDALLLALAKRYGMSVSDDDGTFLGWRLTLERPSVKDLGYYDIRARIDKETDGMMIIVAKKENGHLVTDVDEEGV